MKNILLGVIFIITFNSINAQETEILKDQGAWFTLINKVKLSNKFYFTNIFQQRRVDFLSKTKGYLFAPSINYKLTPNVSFGAGYMFYRYFPNGVSHSSIHKNENRYFQHLNLSSSAGVFKIANRFMFEERVIDLINTNVTPNVIEGDKYVNRFRYRFRATTNLLKLKNNKYLLGRVSEEIRIRFADGITEPNFDQNNFEALLGYNLLSNSTIFAGYGRYYYMKNSSKYVSQNLLHITLSYNFDVSKKKS
ncbi:DUF2490 domain-containing protein [Lutibacter citreus]|uniref:DUF2490 domain-containing protein n=1 Tax=Lutibacter citreus TaxID=2138210 RepID=UPI000DBE7468|nr:DUF2490 domain-containing protein [Lutibacter citreus]